MPVAAIVSVAVSVAVTVSLAVSVAVAVSVAAVVAAAVAVLAARSQRHLVGARQPGCTSLAHGERPSRPAAGG